MDMTDTDMMKRSKSVQGSQITAGQPLHGEDAEETDLEILCQFRRLVDDPIGGQPEHEAVEGDQDPEKAVEADPVLDLLLRGLLDLEHLQLLALDPDAEPRLLLYDHEVAAVGDLFTLVPEVGETLPQGVERPGLARLGHAPLPQDFGRRPPNRSLLLHLAGDGLLFQEACY
eukprot:CAMPEP_0168714626 /NCGR_PEP_ID=MMETSP0503-20121227/44787_1 /TAXON_ID=89963 /ORGANISM="Heterocapsa rotundata, Strain SCCAP K-0483" /LENGTH=171 /DNA_ID=CAMNT_0008761069 /DNA_START=159 /DNA_END=671 /DNA_ORIENTATION=+